MCMTLELCQTPGSNHKILRLECFLLLQMKHPEFLFSVYDSFVFTCVFLCLHNVLFFFQDLCDRHEKGLLNEHQRAIQKMGQYKKKKMSATVQTGAGEVSWHYACHFTFLSDQTTACSGDTQVVWDTAGRLLAKIFAYKNVVLHIAEVDQIFLTHSSPHSSFGGLVSSVQSFIWVFLVYHWFVMDMAKL